MEVVVYNLKVGMEHSRQFDTESVDQKFKKVQQKKKNDPPLFFMKWAYVPGVGLGFSA